LKNVVSGRPRGAIAKSRILGRLQSSNTRILTLLQLRQVLLMPQLLPSQILSARGWRRQRCIDHEYRFCLAGRKGLDYSCQRSCIIVVVVAERCSKLRRHNVWECGHRQVCTCPIPTRS
jgi:hypothetical protein